jgi:hypothetical protein
MNQDELREKLQYILSLSNCNHKVEIMKQPDLKSAHMYCKIHQLSGQVSGPLIENFMKNKEWKKTRHLCVLVM